MLRAAFQAVQILAMPCRRHTELISRGLDEPMGRTARGALWIHMAMCAPCRNFARQLRFLHRAVCAMSERPSALGADRMPEAVRRRIAQVLSRN